MGTNTIDANKNNNTQIKMDANQNPTIPINSQNKTRLTSTGENPASDDSDERVVTSQNLMTSQNRYMDVIEKKNQQQQQIPQGRICKPVMRPVSSPKQAVTSCNDDIVTSCKDTVVTSHKINEDYLSTSPTNTIDAN